MDSRIDIIKGIHPGKFIERELRKESQTELNNGASHKNRFCIELGRGFFRYTSSLL